MKTTLLFALCILLTPGSVSARQAPTSSEAARIAAVLDSYLQVQAHLAADQWKEVKGPAGTIVEGAAALGRDWADVGKAAAALAAATDVKTARDAFGPLSDALVARVRAKGSKALPPDVRLAYCPMVDRSWLQREGPIRNPFYGTSMSNCGEFRQLK